jgi:Divergent InlB B-repeat domain
MGLAARLAGAAGQNSSSPTFDEQIASTFTDNFTSLAYNVTVVAQTGADGYGPSYILNGLTPSDYWYQAGISYHWPETDGSYFPTFGFTYDVFGPYGAPVYPTGTGGAGIENFSTPVNSGDTVLLTLAFVGSTVQMQAHDWNTGGTAQTSYGSYGSSSFLGNPSSPFNFQGYFSGLMTEWYHAAPYSGNEGQVTYTNHEVALTSAWMWIDEFDTASSGPPVFKNDTRTAFANDQQVVPFYADGATMYVSAHQFVTGLPTAASPSKVTLVPSTNGPPGPSFSAAYTLFGQRQTVSIAAGAIVLVGDPGTSMTISITSNPSSSPLGKWVFAGTSGTEVTLAAGANATYVLYHVVREAIAYQVAAGGQALPASSAPVLHYEVPPPVVSATAAPVAATQVVGTAPVVVYALLGSNAGITGTVTGTAGERWVATAQNWTITAAGLIPDPIVFFQQYEVSIGYSLVGSGTPSQAPEFTAAFYGSLTSIPLSSVPTPHWFDAGSAYSFTGLVNGSSGAVRWLNSGEAESAQSVISSPGGAISEVYTPQYYAHLSVNDARGGAVSTESGWFDSGSRLTASASANQGWHFEGWNGSGAGAYNGTSPSIDVVVAGPLSENATFYVQLAITAGAGTSVAYSDLSQTGTVQAGTTKTLYVPPSNVTLRASPSFFVYSFASWQGAGVANAKQPSLVLAVDSPSAVTAKSTYDYAGVGVLVSAAAAFIINILVGSVWIRGRRRKDSLRGFHPGLILPDRPDGSVWALSDSGEWPKPRKNASR